MNDKQFMELKTTKEFDKFKFLEYNRPQEEARINKISELILKHGFLVPVLCTKDYQIIDGQHRFSAAKKIDHEFSYIILDIANEETLPILISGMNSTQKQWKLYEYFDMWLTLGKEEYIKAYNLYTEIGLTQLEFLDIAARSFHKSKTNPVKSGDYKLTKNSEKNLKKVAERLTELFSVDDRMMTLKDNKNLRNALIKSFRQTVYNHDRMLRVIELGANMISVKGSRTAYLSVIEEIYNARLRKENHIKLTR